MKYCHTCGLCANKFFRPFFVAVDGVVVVDAAVVVVAVTTFHSSHSQVPFINTLIMMNTSFDGGTIFCAGWLSSLSSPLAKRYPTFPGI